ncbi:hypothetical protein BOX15_Mlig017264g2 [Macrostomum lignano]|uniref:Cyclic nucleotide-binding domain-containing protein n=1 Tax=Macrostomum lignano TaxID=282301 RepID=A0A267GDV6_9PLAT|nr:hypothetical protein BOX15_Mlig017264g2 [Macrostomum lignano]
MENPGWVGSPLPQKSAAFASGSSSSSAQQHHLQHPQHQLHRHLSTVSADAYVTPGVVLHPAEAGGTPATLVHKGSKVLMLRTASSGSGVGSSGGGIPMASRRGAAGAVGTLRSQSSSSGVIDLDRSLSDSIGAEHHSSMFLQQQQQQQQHQQQQQQQILEEEAGSESSDYSAEQSEVEPLSGGGPGSQMEMEDQENVLAQAQYQARQTFPKFVILHYSPFKAVWDWVILMLVLYTAVFTPYTAAFLLNEDKTKMKLNEDSKTRSSASQSNHPDPLVIIDLIVDVTFIADILINFRTTYVHNGEVISDPQKIALNYMKGWFLLDAIAAIPFDLLLFGSGGAADTMTITGVLKTARLLRLLRVARRIDQYSEYGAAVMLLLMATFTLVAHWFACIFYAIAYVERDGLPAKVGWLDHLAKTFNKPFIENSTTGIVTGGPDIQSKYITALYFTFTCLTSIGFGNVSPNTNAEKIFTILGMLIGSLMSAAIFGNVSSIMLRIYQGSEEFHEKKTSIKEFIKFHKIPKNLAHRLQESFQNSWTYTNGLDTNVVLKTFPECLQADICLHMNRNLLNNCPAFKGASPGCLRAFSMKFHTTHVPPGDTLVHPGDILENIFFVVRGSVEISKDDTVMAVLGRDDIFGDEAIRAVQGHVGQSMYTCRALSYVDLNKISVGDLKEILNVYNEWAPIFKQNFKVTFNLTESDQQALACSMDDETLRFIRQKKPLLQTKSRSNASSAPNTPAVTRQVSEVSSAYLNASSSSAHLQKSFSALAVSLSKWKGAGHSGSAGGGVGGGDRSVEHITHRVDNLNTRMEVFERKLFSTVDGIMQLLGERPKVQLKRGSFSRQQSAPSLPKRSPKRSGPKLLRTATEVFEAIDLHTARIREQGGLQE